MAVFEIVAIKHPKDAPIMKKVSTRKEKTAARKPPSPLREPRPVAAGVINHFPSSASAGHE